MARETKKMVNIVSICNPSTTYSYHAALSITEEQIQAVIRDAAKRYTAMSPAQLREYAIWTLTDPYLNSAPDEIDAYLFVN